MARVDLVVAAVLLYDSKAWCPPAKAARPLTGMRPKVAKGDWVYLHSAHVLWAAGLWTLDHCIGKRRHTIANTQHHPRLTHAGRVQEGGETNDYPSPP